MSVSSYVRSHHAPIPHTRGFFLPNNDVVFDLLVLDSRVIFGQKSCVQRRSVTEHMIAVAYSIIVYCSAEEAYLCSTNEEWLNCT